MSDHSDSHTSGVGTVHRPWVDARRWSGEGGAGRADLPGLLDPNPSHAALRLAARTLGAARTTTFSTALWTAAATTGFMLSLAHKEDTVSADSNRLVLHRSTKIGRAIVIVLLSIVIVPCVVDGSCCRHRAAIVTVTPGAIVVATDQARGAVTVPVTVPVSETAIPVFAAAVVPLDEVRMVGVTDIGVSAAIIRVSVIRITPRAIVFPAFEAPLAVTVIVTVSFSNTTRTVGSAAGIIPCGEIRVMRAATRFFFHRLGNLVLRGELELEVSLPWAFRQGLDEVANPEKVI